MKKNTTKRALWMSVLSLFLCFSMLVGTTFAWFTDEVKSDLNKIVAGNLDVNLYHADKGTRNELKVVDGETKLFDDVTLWEPGAVVYETLKVTNEGTLALKYNLILNVLEETVVNDAKLSDVIKVALIETALTADTTREGLVNSINEWTALSEFAMKQNSVALEAGAEKTVTVVLYWMPNSNAIDNQYNVKNGALNLTIGVTLVATQMTGEFEKDSFGNDFDKDAEYPEVPQTVTSKPAGEAASVEDPEKKVEVEIPASAPAGEYKLDVGTKTYSTDGQGNTVVDVEITLLRDGQEASDVEGEASVYLGVGLTGLQILHDGTPITTFDYNPSSGYVTFTTTFSPFTFTYVDGRFAAVTETAGYKTLADAIANAKNGETITLLKKVTEDVTVVQQPNVTLTIDGNGNTIDGVITVDGKSGTYTTAGLTIKNLIFKADSISADACIRLGNGTDATRYTCNVTVEKCTFDVPGAVGVKSYTGGDKNLTIVGCIATENIHSLGQLKGVDGVLIKNCEVKAARGVNFNNSVNVTIDNSNFDVQKYVVRFGESENTTVETFTIMNSTLKSTCAEDAVIVFRAGATNATLTLANTELEGDVLFMGEAEAEIISATVVSNAEQLVTAMNAGESVVLVNDIDLSGSEWLPVGTEEAPYVGVFNGCGYTINGLTITDSVEGAFIAYLGECAAVKNVKFEDVAVSGKYVASVVYYAKSATIDNVQVLSGAVNATGYAAGIIMEAESVVITNCVNYATITSNFSASGIGAWILDAKVENCTNYGDVTAANRAAGICGNYSGTIIGCTNNGDITGTGTMPAGGIVAVLSGVTTFENCTNNGDVTNTGEDVYNASAGGILGHTPSSAATITGCVNNGMVTAENSVAAGIGVSMYGGITATDCVNSGAVYGATAAEGTVAAKGMFSGKNTVTNCTNTGAVTVG